jgi:hypothetical protein
MSMGDYGTLFALVVILAGVVLYMKWLASREHTPHEAEAMVGSFPFMDLYCGLEAAQGMGGWTEAEAVAHMIRHYQVTIDDWGPQHDDQRFRWTIFDRRSDRSQFMRPLTDWSEVVGVGLPYMLGNAPTAEQAHEDAVLWMAANPTLTIRQELSE